MAVPKKKRSRQLVRSRRTISVNKLLNKYNILIKNYSNFINNNSFSIVSKNVCTANSKSCAYYTGSTSNNVCLDCYTTDFVYAYIKNIY
jgi:hypothetical protein